MTRNADNLTSQQRTAIETRDVSIALSAGAGCGKTFVLTRRFLSQLDPGKSSTKPAKFRRKTAVVKTSPGSSGGRQQSLFTDVEAEPVAEAGPHPLHGLVAITFTERAAREMRDRIRAACHAKLQACDDNEITHWQNILRGLDTARISTIHAFCAAFLRSHAVEAGVDPQFGVLEAATADVVLRRAVSQTVESLLVEENADIMQLVLHFGLERTQSHIRALVNSRFRIGPEDLSSRSVADHTTQWLQYWQENSVPQLLREIADSPLVERVIELLTHNEPSHPVMQQRRQQLLQQLPVLSSANDPLAALTAITNAAKVHGGGNQTAWEDEEVYDKVRQAFTKLRKDANDAIREIDIDETWLEAAVTFSLMFYRVTRTAAEHYEENKRDAGLLDFDDLIMRTRDLLRDSEAVRTRAARSIELLMVDEFQDTDPVQSEIISHLCGGNVTSGRLFLVGDAKQSIYRFRNADPRVFSSIRDQLPERGRLPLSTNFRSQPAILNFVNCLFARTFGSAYEPLVPHAKQLTPEPAIEFQFSSATEEEAQHEKREPAEDRRRREADWIARRIAALLAGNEAPVRTGEHDPEGPGKLRKPCPGDVAILFRTLSNVAIYEEALRNHGIDYYLVGGRAFFAQQEIFDIVNLCSSLDDPDDEVSLAGVLRSPLFGLRDDSLLAMVEEGGTLRAALELETPPELSEQQQEQIRFAASVLSELREKKDRVPLATLLKIAIDRTGYDAALLNEFLGRRKLANLQKLLDMARQFDRSGFATMGEFVTRLRDSIVEQANEELAATHPETSNVVRLMTVHQSKGLEFPIVVVADMDWTRNGGSSGPQHHPLLGPLVPLPEYRGEPRRNIGLRMKRLEEKHEDELEKLRMLYVATTRAADLLILSAGLDPTRKLQSEWMKLIAERFDIDTGLPAHDPYLGRLSIGDVSPDKIPKIRIHRNAPAVPGGKSSTPQLLSLDKFRESVESAEPRPLPEILKPIAPMPGARTILSVSVIDQADRSIRPLALSRTAADPSADVFEEEGESGRNLGTLVHAMLERIDPHRPADLEALASHVAYEQFGSPEPALEAAATSRVASFLSSGAFADISRARRLHREIEFLHRWPRKLDDGKEVLIAGTIDCLAEMPDDRWLLLDYKTGRLPLSEPGAVVERYGLQLAVYSIAAEKLIGRKPDIVEIVAVHDTVERFPIDVSAAFLNAVTERIDAAIERLFHTPR